MKVKVINPSSDSKWDEYVAKHPLGCAFHHSAWKEVLESTFPQLQPLYFVVQNGDGAIKGGIPFFLIKSWLTGTRLVSLPFSLYCDPLVDSQETFQLLLDAILSKHEECGAAFVAFRARYATSLLESTELKKFVGYKNHTLSLDPSLEVLKKSFHRTCVRQRINRGEKSDLTVREASSEKDIKAFYNLHCLSRKKIGLPPQPYVFYKNMWEILYPKRMLGVLIATYRDQPVSSVLFLKYKQRVHAEYMGTNDSFLKYSPNILLFWRAIQLAKEENYLFFDFGGSYVNNLELMTFKRRWATMEEDIPHYYFPEVQGLSADFENSSKYRFVSQASHRMPDKLFRLTGQFLYRHLGG